MFSSDAEKGSVPDHVVATPIWMLAIRVAQFLLALIIVGLSGALMHDAYLDEEGLALAIGLFTWIIVAYIVVTEKIPSLHKAYNIIAVLALDGFLVILWLATWAATAAKRARYTVDVNVSHCSDDGSMIDSISCGVYKRGVILFKSGMAMLAAIAGLGALVWILFVASFVWTLLVFLKGRKEGRFQFGSATGEGNYQPTPPAEQPMAMQPQQPVQPQPMQPQTTGGQYPPPAGTYPPQGQYQPQPPQEAYPQQTQYPQAYPQGPGSSVHSMSPPPQQQPPYSPPQELYTQQEHQPNQQQAQQPYYPQGPQYPQQPQQ